MWIVKTHSDSMVWKFDSIEEALHFYDTVRSYGEHADFPKFNH